MTVKPRQNWPWSFSKIHLKFLVTTFHDQIFETLEIFTVYAVLLILLKITAVVYFQIILNQYLDSLKSIKPLFVLTQ